MKKSSLFTSFRTIFTRIRNVLIKANGISKKTYVPNSRVGWVITFSDFANEGYYILFLSFLLRANLDGDERSEENSPDSRGVREKKKNSQDFSAFIFGKISLPLSFSTFFLLPFSPHSKGSQ